MEIWDGYNADKTLAGVDLIRGEDIPSGLYHMVVEIIVRHTDGTFLLMQRDYNKIGHAGEWEIGAGGSVLKGETPEEGAARELHEETGVAAEKLILLAERTETRKSGFGVHYFTYLCETGMDKDAVTLQEGETIDFRWVERSEIADKEYPASRQVREILLKKL